MVIESAGDASIRQNSLGAAEPHKLLDDTGFSTPPEKFLIKDGASAKASDQQNVSSSSSLSADQINAPRTLYQMYSQFAKESDNFTKSIDPESFSKIAPVWEKAISDNKSISPKTIDSIEERIEKQHDSFMLMSLAMEKSKKTDITQLTQTDMDAVTAVELTKAESESKSRWQSVMQELNLAHAALTPAQQEEFAKAEQNFQDTVQKASKDSSNSLEKVYLSALEAKFADQKALSPDMSKAIDDLAAALKDPKLVVTKQYLENMQAVDDLKHVDQYRIQYAMALKLQGGDENKQKASALVQESMQNPQILEILRSTSDGVRLLDELGIKAAQADDTDRIYPEVKLVRQASLVLSDKSKDPKLAWSEADQLYKNAEKSIDDEIMEKGHGSDLKDSLEKLNAQLSIEVNASLVAARSVAAELEIFKSSPKDFQLEASQRAVIDKVVAGIKGTGSNGTITSNDVIGALAGKQGPEMLSMMKDCLKNRFGELSEKDLASLNNLERTVVLQQKLDLVTAIRYQHAIDASRYGFNNNDEKSKALAGELVESINTLDPLRSYNNPQFLGVMKQAELGRQLEIQDGKAEAIFHAYNAYDSIDKIGLFTNKQDSERLSDEAVARIAAAQLKNASEAQRVRDQVVSDARTQGSGLAGDIGGTLASLLGGGVALKGLQYLAADAPGMVKAPIALSVAITTGGVTNNLLHDSILPVQGAESEKRGAFSGVGFARNIAWSGATLLAFKGRSLMPGNQLASAEQLAQLGLDPASKMTSAQVVGAVIEKQRADGLMKLAQSHADLNAKLPAALELDAASVRAGQPAQEAWKISEARKGLQESESVLSNSILPAWAKKAGLLNPFSYTPFTMSSVATLRPFNSPIGINVMAPKYVGFGGERTLQALADGTINVYDYSSRLTIANAATMFGTGFSFGAITKGAAIATGESLEAKNYNWNRALSDMTTDGINTGLATAFVLPLAGKFVPGVVKNSIGSGVTGLFSVMTGVDAAAASRGLGTASMFFARPVYDAGSRYSNSELYRQYYDIARNRQK